LKTKRILFGLFVFAIVVAAFGAGFATCLYLTIGELKTQPPALEQYNAGGHNGQPQQCIQAGTVLTNQADTATAVAIDTTLVAGTQFSKPEGLLAGEWVNRIGPDGDSDHWILLTEAYTDNNGACRFDAVNVDDIGHLIGTIYSSQFCTDSGLVPYDSGQWSKYHLVLARNTVYSPLQVMALMQVLQDTN
jgi:hypothetical protein